jgi:hypothetical protein
MRPFGYPQEAKYIRIFLVVDYHESGPDKASHPILGVVSYGFNTKSVV